MTIRILVESDAPAWWELRREALEREPFAFGKSLVEHQQTSVESIAQRFRETSEDSFTVGAFAGGVLVGTATYLRETGLKERHKGRIYGVYVSGTERRKGVGRALLTDLVERVKRDPSVEQLLLAMAIVQSAARQLYQGFGFVTFGMEPRSLKVGTEYIDEDHMILWLR